MLSSDQKIGRKVGVFSVRKPKSGKARDAGKGRRYLQGKANSKKGKVHVLRQGGRQVVRSKKCSADPACAWPVVDRGLCVFHLRDLYG